MAPSLVNGTAALSDPANEHMLDPLNPKYHPFNPLLQFLPMDQQAMLWSLARIAAFALIFRAFDFPILFCYFQRRRPELSDKRRWRLRNEVTSLVHATVSGLWALVTFAAYPDAFVDMIWWFAEPIYWLVSELHTLH